MRLDSGTVNSLSNLRSGVQLSWVFVLFWQPAFAPGAEKMREVREQTGKNQIFRRLS
jgi:hypothetical protein